ncbi:OmpA family protein [bacterium]|nr:OmpA family protein [bacterium]
MIFSFWQVSECQTARPLGFSNAYVGVADDINAIYYNPAGLSLLKFREVYGGFSKYFWGFSGENMISTSLSYAHSTNKYGCFAVSGEQFSHPVLKEFSFLAAYSYPVINKNQLKLSVGVSSEIYRLEYDKDEFYEFDFNDPLFIENGYSTYDFAVNSGIFASYSRYSAGLTVNNINKPSLGLNRNNEDANKPLHIDGGFSYNYLDFISPMLQVSWDDINQVEVAGGIESWFFEKQLALRIGANSNKNISFGFGLFLKKNNIIGFDYAITYYASELKSTTHRLSASVKFPLPKPYVPPKKYADLEILRSDVSITDTNRIIDETLAYETNIKNIGKKEAKSFKVAAIYEKNDSLIEITTQEVNRLEADEERLLKWGWRAPQIGKYKLTIILDDDGSLYPQVNETVLESDEANNRTSLNLFFYAKPIGSITLKSTKLPLVEMTYIKEEEPLVPVVFFEPNTADVDERFNKTLKVISQRLQDNPDVEIHLYGFIDENTDPKNWEEKNLHISRAEKVKNLMVSFGSDKDKIVVVRDGYDPTRKRAGKSGVFYSTRDSIWSSQENRRVEIIPHLKEDIELTVSESFEEGDTILQKTFISKLNDFAERITPLLKRNPNLNLMVEGYPDEVEKYMKCTFTRLKQAREYLLETFKDQSINKEIPVILMPQSEEKGKLQVTLVTDALIYKPVEYSLAGKDIEIPEDKRINEIDIDLSSTVDIDTFSVSIDEIGGEVVNKLTSGVGYPPKVVDWNWKDAHGNIVDPEEEYVARVYIKDKIGNTYEFKSDTARVTISKEEQRMQSIVVIQFVFDELYHESKFFSSRLEQFADLIIEKAQKPNKVLKVKVVGHTDMTGTGTRNRQLSKERALKELTTIEYYLINKLGLDNNDELDKWLSERSTTLESRGASFNEPLEMERFREGKYEEVLLGNNDFPEGRSINRRVVIEFEERKLK